MIYFTTILPLAGLACLRIRSQKSYEANDCSISRGRGPVLHAADSGCCPLGGPYCTNWKRKIIH